MESDQKTEEKPKEENSQEIINEIFKKRSAPARKSWFGQDNEQREILKRASFENIGSQEKIITEEAKNEQK